MSKVTWVIVGILLSIGIGGSIVHGVLERSRPSQEQQPTYASDRSSTHSPAAQNKKSPVEAVKQRFSKNESTSKYAKQLNQSGCKGKGPVTFTHPPMKPEDVTIVLPYGLLAGGHVTPIDHMYFSPKDFNSKADTYPVYAIADGTIATIGFRGENVEGHIQNKSGKKGDYRLDVAYNCTFFSYYDLITSLSPGIAAKVSTDTTKSWHEKVTIPIKAGEEIGRIGGQTLDWAVYNTELTLPGLLIPDHYDREPWKIHTDYKSLDYFAEPIRTQLYGLLARQVEPRIGKIDYDIDGKLVGNWFLEGTNGYAGAGSVMQYWGGHLAVVPDYIDPKLWHFSTGDWDGKATQFAINPDKDPSTVGVGELVKYELFMSEYVNADTGKQWMSNQGPIANPKGRIIEQKQGVVLLELIAPRKLKVETFPGKSASEVTAFASSAKIYER